MVDTARRAVGELAASRHRAFTRKPAAALAAVLEIIRDVVRVRAGELRDRAPAVEV